MNVSLYRKTVSIFLSLSLSLRTSSSNFAHWSKDFHGFEITVIRFRNEEQKNSNEGSSLCYSLAKPMSWLRAVQRKPRVRD